MSKGLFLLTSLMLLASCAGSPYTRHHPQKNAWIPSNPTVAILMPGPNLLVSRPSWFAGRLGLPESLIQDTLVALAERSLDEGLRAHAYPGMVRLPLEIGRALGPSEGRRVSDYVFVRGNLPLQGQVIRTGSTEPNLILFLHEVTLGLDLDREQLYDIRKANQPRELSGQVPQQLTLVASWTLWDNQRQQALSWGISQSMRPIAPAPEAYELRELFIALTRALASDLKGGSR